jgi:DNA-binding transcriptional ArsR family regulator
VAGTPITSTLLARSSPRDAVFEALADPTRRAVLELLRITPVLTAGDIAAAFPAISRPAVSRHLRVLREAGLVVAVKNGREWQYSIDPAPLAELTQRWFAQFAPLWEETLASLKQRAEE